jgi:hypothetical protein
MLAGSTLYVVALMILSYGYLPLSIPFRHAEKIDSVCTKYYQIFICQGLLVGVWNLVPPLGILDARLIANCQFSSRLASCISHLLQSPATISRNAEL